jgi:hypothetical protein
MVQILVTLQTPQPIITCSNVTLLIVDMGPKVMVCSFNFVIINITVISMVGFPVNQQV